MALKEHIDKTRLPQHIAIIMDGNGRWAKQKGNKRIFGHTNAISAVRDTIEGCAELGIRFLTLYAFSTENWNRPKDEVDALMSLLVSTIQNEKDNLKKNNIRLLTIGDTENLPTSAKKQLAETMQYTSGNTGLTLILALSYSSRWEISNAMKLMAQDVKDNKLDPSSINSGTVQKYLQTCDFPDPELLIRTSGEYRISNFLLWQIAYTELFFTDVLWPDFRKEHLHQAIYDFQNRERRFGKTSEQIKQQS